jgi:hypothetical protein
VDGKVDDHRWSLATPVGNTLTPAGGVSLLQSATIAQGEEEWSYQPKKQKVRRRLHEQGREQQKNNHRTCLNYMYQAQNQASVLYLLVDLGLLVGSREYYFLLLPAAHTNLHLLALKFFAKGGGLLFRLRATCSYLMSYLSL